MIIQTGASSKAPVLFHQAGFLLGSSPFLARILPASHPIKRREAEGREGGKCRARTKEEREKRVLWAPD